MGFLNDEGPAEKWAFGCWASALLPSNAIIVHNDDLHCAALFSSTSSNCSASSHETLTTQPGEKLKMVFMGGICLEGLCDFQFQGFNLKHAHLTVLLILLRVLGLANCSGIDYEGEALIDIRSALNDSRYRIGDWNTFLVSPCFSWSHVICDDGHVISLSLASNEFTGTLSPSITKLKFLVKLELQNNHLSGLLPDYLSNLSHLTNLNLADNNFNGSIPSTWNQLSNLKFLDLSSNNLTGIIPKKLVSVPTFNFTGNHLDCGSTLQQPCVSSSSITGPARKSNFGYVVGGAGSGFLLLSIGAILIYWKYRAQNFRRDVFFDVSGEDERKITFGQLRRFSWRELQLATDYFSETNVLGQGGFGKVYRGVLSDNTEVAVKRLNDYHNPGGEAAFLREVELISVAVHRNLLRLIGICVTTSERVLVYPFMQNLSVAHHLRDLKPGDKVLDWHTRKRVAFGAANGLEYLHEQCNPKIIHRDLKAANILLDEYFEPVLGDFGLVKVIDTTLTHVTTQVRGTMGHIAPEYLSTGKTSEKTDVFGYGIMLLELVTGQRAIDFSRLEEEEDVLLLDHIKKLQRDRRLHDIVDSNLKQDYDTKEVEIVVQVALLCTQSSPEDRPTMAEVVYMLQGVGLAERWEEWQQLEVIRNQDYSSLSHHLDWTEDSSYNQKAIELSEAR